MSVIVLYAHKISLVSNPFYIVGSTIDDLWVSLLNFLLGPLYDKQKRSA
jgi:hypothetical protein